MRSRLRRRLAVAIRGPLAAAGAVLGPFGFVLGIVLSALGFGKGQYYIFAVICAIASAAAAIFFVRGYRAQIDKGLFSPIHFDPLDGEQRKEVICRIIEAESARPEFAEVVPAPRELGRVLDDLLSFGQAHIVGGPGEGKSLLAYLAARSLWEDGYRVYRLEREQLFGLSRDSLIDNIDALRGGFRVIIIDDAHLLDVAEFAVLKGAVNLTTSEVSAVAIWISTENPEESPYEAAGSATRIDYADFAEAQAGFIRDSSRIYAEARGRPPRMKMAPTSAIGSAWHLSFIASQGRDRLSSDVQDLTSLELLALFTLSSRTVVSGITQIKRMEAQNLLNSIDLGWVRDELRSTSFGDVLESLSGKTSNRSPLLLRKGRRGSEISYASLHYNFARIIVQVSLGSESVAGDLVAALPHILKGRSEDLRYLGALCEDLGAWITPFLADNAQTIKRFLGDPENSGLANTVGVLRVLAPRVNEESVAGILNPFPSDSYAVLISRSSVEDLGHAAACIKYIKPLEAAQIGIRSGLDAVSIRRALEHTTWRELNGVAAFLLAVDYRRADIVADLDLTALIRAGGEARLPQIEAMTRLITVLGVRRDDFLAGLEWSGLGESVSLVRPSRIWQVNEFMAVLGEWKSALIRELDIARLAASISGAAPKECEAVAKFLESFIDRWDELVTALDMGSLAASISNASPRYFGSVARFIGALNDRRGKLTGELDIENLATSVNQAPAKHFTMVAPFIASLDEGRREKLIDEVSMASLADAVRQASPGQLGAVAGLLNALGDRRVELIRVLNFGDVALIASRAAPEHLKFVTGLLNAFGAQREALIKEIERLSSLPVLPAGVGTPKSM
ncbi:hypothetical protein ACFVW5_02350 [Streptomyces sp. NPDC058232]|uniref:hypothetical protein n=1 Tax=Streptomyces sp. NPDC058232 TaxID=3346393 RepID=UPI0036E175AD